MRRHSQLISAACEYIEYIKKAYYESLNYDIPSESFDLAPDALRGRAEEKPVLLNPVKITTTPTGEVVERLYGKELKQVLESKRQEEERKSREAWRDKVLASYEARQFQYRSPRWDQEDLVVFPPHEKALCLKEGIKSLSLTGILECYESIPAPVFADERGVVLAERLFEANPIESRTIELHLS